MKRKNHNQITFKNYQPNQLMLPTDLELQHPFQTFGTGGQRYDRQDEHRTLAAVI